MDLCALSVHMKLLKHGSTMFDLLYVMPHTGVQLQDMVADEPHEVGEIRSCCLVTDETEHTLVLHYNINEI